MHKYTKHVVGWQILFINISKGFWNNRGQNSLGERGGIRFNLPLPWRHNQIFSDG